MLTMLPDQWSQQLCMSAVHILTGYESSLGAHMIAVASPMQQCRLY